MPGHSAVSAVVERLFGGAPASGSGQPGRMLYLSVMHNFHTVDTRRAAGRLSSRCGILVLAIGALMSGCGDSDATAAAEEGVTAGEFVEIVTALREAEREVVRKDSAEALYAERKAEILGRHDATEADLRAFLERHGEDPAKLQEVWDTISQRLKHVPGGPDAGEQRLH